MIKKLALVSVLVVLLPFMSPAQSEFQNLTVGSYLPDIVFHDLINYKDSTAKLSDFQGKLVILDFWGTNCGTCIKEFKKLDSLQFIYQDRVQFLLITHPVGEPFTSDSLKEVFRNWQQKRRYIPKMPIAVGGNQDIIQMFPHEFIPHFVWIDNHRQIKAITNYQLMNGQTIETLLNNK